MDLKKKQQLFLKQMTTLILTLVLKKENYLQKK